jgi:hypothetical protein
MATPLTLEVGAEEAQYQAQAQHYLNEIVQVNQAMARDQQEIEQLQAETRRLLTDMQVVLRKIEAR